MHIIRLLTSEETRQGFLRTAAALGLTPAGLHALLTLRPDVERPMRTLAAEWHCDPSQVTAVVDQLEQREFAGRHSHGTDRRMKTVRLTSSGEAARGRALKLPGAPPPV